MNNVYRLIYVYVYCILYLYMYIVYLYVYTSLYLRHPKCGTQGSTLFFVFMS